MSLPVLQTPRLRLRPRTPDDLDANLAMDLDPEVTHFIWPEPPDPAAHRAVLAARIASGWPEVGAVWVVEWREAPGLLGWCGLFPLDGTDEIELGYRYVRKVWGQGVATEAGRAVLAHGFGSMGLERIVGVTDPANHASKRVLAKLGMLPAGRGRYYGRELDRFGLGRTDVVSG
ncbi:MAG: GNAT family N-acetyltransferase [Pseudomonadota bacterium]